MVASLKFTMPELCCRHSFPIMVVLNPFLEHALDFTALTNLMWLMCPHLNERIHALESEGLVSEIGKLVKQSPSYSNSMKRAHAEFALLRLKMCGNKLDDAHFFNSFSKVFNTGIGGIRDIEKVKCLHIHYIHSLICRHNVVGKIVSKLLDNDISCSKIICCNTKIST